MAVPTPTAAAVLLMPAPPRGTAIAVARVGATIVLSGIKAKNALSVNVDRILYKELIIRGVYSQGNEANREAFRIIGENPPDLASMHTHEFKLEDPRPRCKHSAKSDRPRCPDLTGVPGEMGGRLGSRASASNGGGAFGKFSFGRAPDHATTRTISRR